MLAQPGYAWLRDHTQNLASSQVLVLPEPCSGRVANSA